MFNNIKSLALLVAVIPLVSLITPSLSSALELKCGDKKVATLTAKGHGSYSLRARAGASVDLDQTYSMARAICEANLSNNGRVDAGGDVSCSTCFWPWGCNPSQTAYSNGVEYKESPGSPHVSLLPDGSVLWTINFDCKGTVKVTSKCSKCEFFSCDDETLSTSDKLQCEAVANQTASELEQILIQE